MNNAELLRKAADLVEEYAKGTTPGPWGGHGSEHIGSASVYGGPVEHGYRTTSVMGWSEETVQEYGGEPSGEDMGWLCLMAPHVAGPLVAVLRAAAEDAERIGSAPRDVALARAILGEVPQ